MAESNTTSNSSGASSQSPSSSAQAAQPAKFTPSKNVTPITTGQASDAPKTVPSKASPAVKKKAAAKKKAAPKKAAAKKPAAKKAAAKKPAAKKAAPKKVAAKKPAAKKKAAPKKVAKKVASSATKAASSSSSSIASLAAGNNPFAAINDAAKSAYQEAGKMNQAAFSGFEKWSAKASKQISEATKEQTRLIDACMKCKNIQDIAKVQAEIAATALEYQINGAKESAELISQLSKQQAEIASKIFSSLSSK